MSYLEKWWRDASDEKRESFVTLVKNGQLEIVGGGWVMNDEVICSLACFRFFGPLTSNCEYSSAAWIQYFLLH